MSYSEHLLHHLTGPKFNIDDRIAKILLFECNNLREIPLEYRTSVRVKNALEDSLVIFPNLINSDNFNKEDLLDLLKDYVSKVLGIIAQKGNELKEAEHKEWLQDLREEESYDAYYWNRLQKYLLEENIIPPLVINTLDHDSDKITDLLGNPNIKEPFQRRGMVMGSVQSGKTLSYSSVITKAADAGYKVIVLVTTNANKLRMQTQERIDDAFIGRKTVKGRVSSVTEYTGVGIPPYTETNQHRFPIYFTNTSEDYNAAVSKIDTPVTSISTPIIFVVKKNVKILQNIIKFFENEEPIVKKTFPLLLIDDEADNASINTKAHLDSENNITLTNRRIRELLNIFSKATYLAYTATPYANIFILPDNRDEMIGDDLFPKNFIYALNPPSNYFGPNKIFTDEKTEYSHCVEEIEDYYDVIPIKHKNGFPIPHLPASLKEAVLSFIILRCIFIIKGMGTKHCTMMVNVSPFNSVQNDLAEKLYIYLNKVQKEIELEAKRTDKPEENSTIIAQIKKIFAEKFEPHKDTADEVSWKNILINLIEGSKTIKLETSQQRSGALDYKGNSAKGLHVIVVGGYTLSRGLTLEGLCVSYLIRNASAYDILLQMGRWFGYRDNYEKFCKIYLPSPSINWYKFVTSATNELYLEIEKMNEEKRTPEEFGLKVRNHPDTLRITALNKMRAAQSRMIAIDYSNQHMQAFRVINNEETNNYNRQIVKEFLSNLGKNIFTKREEIQISKKDIYWNNIDVNKVIIFLKKFKFSDALSHFNNKLFNNSFLILDYIIDRKSEFNNWDILVPSGTAREYQEKEILPGQLIIPAARNAGGVEKGTNFFIGNESRQVTSADVYKKGVSLKNKIRLNPMLFIHIQKCERIRENSERKYDMPVFKKNYVTISIDFPKSKIKSEEKEYMINSVAQQQELSFLSAEDEEQL